MPSNSAKGAYYKARTKRWLEEAGFAVGHLEEVHRIPRPGGFIPVKRDQFGADLLAVSTARVVFVQVKFCNHEDKLFALALAKAAKEFRRFPIPHCGAQWIAVWRKGAHAPTIIEVAAGLTAAVDSSAAKLNQTKGAL